MVAEFDKFCDKDMGVLMKLVEVFKERIKLENAKK